MIAYLAALACLQSFAEGTQIQFPQPPYRRDGTFGTDIGAIKESNTVSNTVYTGGKTLKAVDLQNLKTVWEQTPSKGGILGDVSLNNGKLYCLSFDFNSDDYFLYGFDAKTGKEEWRYQVGTSGPMTVDGKFIYLPIQPGQLSAFNIDTKKVEWTTPLTDLKLEDWQSWFGEITTKDDMIVTTALGDVWGIDKKNGKIIWSIKDTDMHLSEFMLAQNENQSVFLCRKEQTYGSNDVKTGTSLWEHKGYISIDSFLIDNKYICLSLSEIKAIDPYTGETLWTYLLSETDGGFSNSDVERVGNLILVTSSNESVILDVNGKVLAKSKEPFFTGTPVRYDINSILTLDSGRLIRYVPGMDEPIPTTPEARRVLARELAEKFEQLDKKERDKLSSLGDDAFEPVLAKYLELCQAYDKLPENDQEYESMSMFSDLGEILGDITTKTHADIIIDIVTHGKYTRSSAGVLYSLFGKYAPEEVSIPYFVKALEGVEIPDFEFYSSFTYIARQYVLRSTHPAATEYLIRSLKSPKADPVIRFETYSNIASKSSDAADAVIALQRKRFLLEPFADRLTSYIADLSEEMDQAFTKEPDFNKISTDGAGRTYGIFNLSFMGSYTDLWFAEKINGKWSNPKFTGTNIAIEDGDSNEYLTSVKLEGRTADQLLKDNWSSILDGSVQLSLDSDNDGLTDIVEKRFGTDPQKPDTDGDGAKDSIDPWPNASFRELNDAEQVLNAAFEARHFLQSFSGIALFRTPEDAEPFEMIGRVGQTIWHKSGSGHPLEYCFNQGIQFLGFTEMNDDKSLPWLDRVIKWNDDKTIAALQITRVSGGLNGDGFSVIVQKIKNKWVVVSLHQAWVS